MQEVEVTPNNNVNYDGRVYAAGSVFTAEKDAAEALIEAGAVVAVKAEVEEAPQEPAKTSKKSKVTAEPAADETAAAEPENAPEA